MTITIERVSVSDAWGALVKARESGAGVWAAEGLLTIVAALDDTPLCTWCLNPDATIRTCCGAVTCEAHEEDHDTNADNCCPEFAAQILEEAR